MPVSKFDDADACSCDRYDTQGICRHISGAVLKGRATGTRLGHGKRPSDELVLFKTCTFKQNGYCKFGLRCKLRAGHEKEIERKSILEKKKTGQPAKYVMSMTKQTTKLTALEDGVPLPIASFFARHSSFNYNSDDHVRFEFQRMRLFYGWKNGDEKFDEAKKAFRRALVEQFNKIYGTEANADGWYKIAIALGVHRAPEVTDFKEAVTKAHFNLVDLIDRKDLGSPVPTFSTSKDLNVYTSSSKKFFPSCKDESSVDAGPLLRALLVMYGLHKAE